jgi:two-component system, response regulator YesN
MLRVLIVDENRIFRDAFREDLLHHLPFISIHEAINGQEAMEKIHLMPPSLIFMDICLPGLNGLQLTNKIKKDYPNIRVAILTCHDLPEYQEAAIKSGADTYLIKDIVKWEEIERLVNSILKDNQRREERY